MFEPRPEIRTATRAALSHGGVADQASRALQVSALPRTVQPIVAGFDRADAVDGFAGRFERGGDRVGVARR